MIIPEVNQFIRRKRNKEKLTYITISELEKYPFSLPGSNLNELISEFQKLYNERQKNVSNLIKMDEKIKQFNKLLK